MTDDQHGEGTPRSAGRWDPLPQGDYDDGATAFVKLPEGGIDALLASADSPLAAPGHGYVPPRITAAPGQGDGTDPGAWGAPAEGSGWPDANAVPPGQTGQFTYNPASTQQWNVEDTAAAPAPGHDVTGQWSIPVAGGDLPDESGEFTTSSLVEQWGGTPPATLPGGAAAPWATQPAQPWGDQGQGGAGAGPEHGEPGDTGHTHVPHGDGHGGFESERGGFEDGRGDFGEGRREGFDGGHRGGFEDGRGDGFDGGRGDGFEDGRREGFEGGHGGGPEDGQAHVPGDGHAHVPAGDGVGGADDRHDDPAGDPPVPSAAHTGHPHAEPGVAAHDPARPHGDTDGHGLTVPHDGSAEPYEGSPSAPASEPTPGAGGTSGGPGASEDAQGAVEAADGPEEPGAEHTAADGEDEPGPDTAEEHAGDSDERPDDQAPAAPGEEHPLAAYVLRVNGVDRPVTDAWIGESLLYVLRERLGLAGAKDGCSQGECGACNVQVDGRLVASCLVPAVTAAGSEVRTVEGLAEDGRPSDVQRALARCGAVQCGFCVPGMAMTVHDLLEGNPAPTELETRQALCGNLCRCSGYRGVVDAVKEVVAEREAHAAADAETDGDEARIPHQAGPGAGGVHQSAFDSPGFPGTSGPHEQAYGQGQDGGQA
ncbi:2Fe-2S iron-sulfur cluster-binding protein [Streptomyces griseorubiginosus]|uniref:2Fe-2S iron-sulfur cluster-binding protein n=1 Tax=Streptomyces griseorubiginosus TaxID=67304 RepID=UPI0036BEB4B0